VSLDDFLEAAFFYYEGRVAVVSELITHILPFLGGIYRGEPTEILRSVGQVMVEEIIGCSDDRVEFDRVSSIVVGMPTHEESLAFVPREELFFDGVVV